VPRRGPPLRAGRVEEWKTSSVQLGAHGDAARAILPDVVKKSHDRLCTVSRTIEVGTPVTTRKAKEQR
jgi:putative redox protein